MTISTPMSPLHCSARQRTALAAAMLLMPLAGHAFDFGPNNMFRLTGFGKVEAQVGSNRCDDCQVFQSEGKDKYWADELLPGKRYNTQGSNVTLMQPWLAANYDLGKGFKASGLLSKRWRDGKEDIPGFWHEKNVAISHDEYGSLRVGAMTTRAWAIADFPYGTNIGLASTWGSSGAGYGLMTNALRYTSRILDVADGDLVLEVTHDWGKKGFNTHKPSFWEFYAQYHKGDLVVDAMYQNSRNGTPSAWGQGPFTGPTPSPADDSKVGGSGQSIAMAMARYQVDSKIEVSGGIRRNRWSGAYAAITVPATANTKDQWNNMFNVDWGGTLNGVANPGYAATSVDVMAGARYRMGQWTFHTGMAYLGKANTNNPSERGQSNSALVNTLGANYAFNNGFQVYGFAGMVHYGRLGLSPLSMPGNSSFTNVDSRIAQNGNWVGIGSVYVF